MYRRVFSQFAGLLLAAVAILAAAPAGAHPHAWIDVKVKVLFDAKGRVYALDETWIFDPLYTAFALEDPKRPKDAAPDQATIDAVSKVNFKNIGEYDYLTLVENNGKKVRLAGARDLTSGYTDNRLWMRFTVPLETPLDPTVSPIDYLVFDPTYYIEMLHAEGGGAIELKGAGKDCKYVLKAANPDPNAVALAASLDKTQSAGAELGQLFAERVTIRCGVVR